MMFDIDDKTAANERIHSRYMSVSNQQIDSANSRRKRSQQILLEIIVLNLGCQRVEENYFQKIKNSLLKSGNRRSFLARTGNYSFSHSRESR